MNSKKHLGLWLSLAAAVMIGGLFLFIGVSSSSHADERERAYIEALHDQGWAGSDAEAMDTGRRVCAELDEKGSLTARNQMESIAAHTLCNVDLAP